MNAQVNIRKNVMCKLRNGIDLRWVASRLFRRQEILNMAPDRIMTESKPIPELVSSGASSFSIKDSVRITKRNRPMFEPVSEFFRFEKGQHLR